MARPTSVQIYIKFGVREVFVPWVQIWLYSTDFTALRRICLTLSHIVNAITLSIFGVILCMSAGLYHKDSRTQWNTPCPSSSPGEVVAVFQISLCVQIQTEFRQLLSSWHFWKSNIFFICGILFVHVSGMLAQTLYITRVNSLSRLECWSNCNEACNQANWAHIWSNQLWLGIFEIIQNSWRFGRSVNYEKCSKFDFVPPGIFLECFSIPSYLFSAIFTRE
jgi:hypothetical protein